MSATEADFADYFRQHHPDVVRFVVRRINDREVAMEIASDVFRIRIAVGFSQQRAT